jgi:hypothetical protein
MMLPKKPFREERFWATGSRLAKTPNLTGAIQQAVSAEREERNAGLLGHKRHRSHLRARTSKRHS